MPSILVQSSNRSARKMSIFQKNLKRATIKHIIIHLSKLLKSVFRKSRYVFKKKKKKKKKNILNVPYRDTRLQICHC